MIVQYIIRAVIMRKDWLIEYTFTFFSSTQPIIYYIDTGYCDWYVHAVSQVQKWRYTAWYTQVTVCIL